MVKCRTGEQEILGSIPGQCHGLLLLFLFVCLFVCLFFLFSLFYLFICFFLIFGGYVFFCCCFLGWFDKKAESKGIHT